MPDHLWPVLPRCSPGGQAAPHQRRQVFQTAAGVALLCAQPGLWLSVYERKGSGQRHSRQTVPGGQFVLMPRVSRWVAEVC